VVAQGAVASWFGLFALVLAQGAVCLAQGARGQYILLLLHLLQP
ncbi:hypothetical protein A2U01_0094143, partial [Trifolium medium]|nr:hypothetical protein [Trifolium medium]